MKRGRQANAQPAEQAENSESVEVSPAQDMARRIWAMQSPDLPKHVRLARIEAALADQSLTMEGVVLP